MDIGYEIIIALFLIAGFAGFIDAAAGGGGLITIPALMLTGISPVQALATNKLQASFGSFSASLHFIRQGIVKPSSMLSMIAMVALTSSIGAIAVQQFDTAILLNIMPIVFIGIAIYAYFSKNLGSVTTQQRLSTSKFTATAASSVGFYDGFFGPGTGTFFALAFVKLLGMDFIKATAHAKVLNFTTNICSLLIFIGSGQVIWLLGFSMAIGQLLGAKLGAKAVIKKGANYIRLLTVVVAIAMSVGLLLKR